MAQDAPAYVTALQHALDQDTDILRRRRSELIQLRTALAGQQNAPLQEREIYLVGSIKRIEEQIAVVRRVIGDARQQS